MKRVRESSGHDDGLISQLPDNVIHDILLLLPIKEAARTAILSSTWRRHWRGIPQLVFDSGFAPPIAEPNNLIPSIYKTLLAHDGPVTKFVLAVPGLTPCDEIDQIILHLSAKCVQDFALVLSMKDSNMYSLPASLFTALQLNHLELGGCSFMAPQWFAGFRRLKKLVLTEVNMTSDFFENFLPRCQLLRSLAIINCTGHEKLEPDAPRLKRFTFVGDLQKLCFKHTPCLSLLRLRVARGLSTQRPNLVALFASLPLLQELHVASKLLEVLGKGSHISARLPSPLRRLKILCVYHNFSGSTVEKERGLACLIASSPNLHSLMIRSEASQLNQPAVTSIGSFLEAEHRRGPCLQHLKVFTIKDSYGSPPELQLARFIFANAPKLLRIHIKASSLLCSTMINELREELKQYKRISQAKIIYD